jgi:hypothetical protein
MISRTTLRGIALAAVGVLSATILPAQIRYIELGIDGFFVQTSNSSPQLVRANFNAMVSGNDLQNMVAPNDISGIAAPTIVVGGGNLQGNTLTLTNSNSSRWIYSSTSYPNNTSAFGDYGSGTYTVTAGGATYSMGFPSTIAAPSIPQATFSSGSWVNGVLNVDPTQALTISTNTFSANYVAGKSAILVSVSDLTDSGPGAFQPQASTFSTFTGQTESLNIAANALTPGHTYQVEIDFDVLVNATGIAGPDTTTTSGVTAFAVFQRETVANFLAVPEPATWALLGGAAALGLAMWRRRRAAA